MPSPQLNQPYTVATVSCDHCKQKQVVQILARAGFWLGACQLVNCLKCGQEFAVELPDTIIGGPYLPQRPD